MSSHFHAGPSTRNTHWLTQTGSIYPRVCCTRLGDVDYAEQCARSRAVEGNGMTAPIVGRRGLSYAPLGA